MTSTDYQNLVRRDELVEEMERMLDAAARSNRNLLASEQRRFDSLMAERNRVDESLSHLSRMDEQSLRRRFGPPSTVPEAPQHLRRDHDFLDDFAEMIRENRDGHVDLDIGSLLAGKRTLRNGAIEHRSALLTTTTGVPVPITTANSVYEYLVTGSGVLRSNVDILNTPAGETYRLPRFTAYSTGTAVPQGTAIPQSDPTFAHVEFGAWKYAALTEWSRELEFDTNVPLGTYLGRNLGVAISESIAPQLVNGAGTAGPQGILAAAGGTVTGGTGVAGMPTVAEIIDLVYTLESPYQAAASFVMHPTTLAKIAKITDDNKRSILVPSLATDVPSTILGYPVFTDPAMPTTGTSKASVFYGDLSRYMIVRWAGSLRVEVSYDAKFAEDLVQCRAVQRVDSRIVDPKAGAVYVGGAS